MLDYSTFLIDLDGVVFRGNQLCPGAREFVQWLDSKGKKYLFLTNGSAASQAQVSDKLTRLGIATDCDQVLGAGEAAVRNIARRFPGGRVYLVGELAMQELLLQHGLSLVNESSQSADVVLCCLDRAFDYAKLTGAVQALRGGAAFIAANRDALLPVDGSFLPGCGALVSAIEASSGIAPEVIGKPQTTLFLEAIRKLRSTPQDTVMIGDNLEIDVLGGKRAGAQTILLLSGVSKFSDLANAIVTPDHVYQNLATLLAHLGAVGSE